MLLSLDWCTDPQADVAAFQEKEGNILACNPGCLSDIFERSKVLNAKHPELIYSCIGSQTFHRQHIP